MLWPCTAKLNLISSVSTTAFTTVPQVTQESIQLLLLNAGPIRNCFDASVITLIYEKICNCTAHFSPQFNSETDFWHHVNVWRMRMNFCMAYFIFLQLVHLWPRQTTMSNVKTVGWLCQAKYAVPVYYFIVEENMPQQAPEWPYNQIKGKKMPAQTNRQIWFISWCSMLNVKSVYHKLS